MSYARLSNDSDVYVFATSESYQCCGCFLLKKAPWNFNCETPQEMISHLRCHAVEGHKVPYRAILELEHEIDLVRIANVLAEEVARIDEWEVHIENKPPPDPYDPRKGWH